MFYFGTGFENIWDSDAFSKVDWAVSFAGWLWLVGSHECRIGNDAGKSYDVDDIATGILTQQLFMSTLWVFVKFEMAMATPKPLSWEKGRSRFLGPVFSQDELQRIRGWSITVCCLSWLSCLNWNWWSLEDVFVVTTSSVVRNREGYQSMMFGLTPFLLLAFISWIAAKWDCALGPLFECHQLSLEMLQLWRVSHTLFSIVSSFMHDIQMILSHNICIYWYTYSKMSYSTYATCTIIFIINLLLSSLRSLVLIPLSYPPFLRVAALKLSCRSGSFSWSKVRVLTTLLAVTVVMKFFKARGKRGFQCFPEGF